MVRAPPLSPPQSSGAFCAGRGAAAAELPAPSCRARFAVAMALCGRSPLLLPPQRPEPRRPRAAQAFVR